MDDHPVALPGVRFVRAVCPCGHVGKSQSPEHYRCTYCYYTVKAQSSERKAKKLRARAVEHDADRERFRAKAAAFRKKNAASFRKRKSKPS